MMTFITNDEETVMTAEDIVSDFVLQSLADKAHTGDRSQESGY